MTLTRATLGKLTSRKTKTFSIGEHTVTIQKPTPLEYSQYQVAMAGSDGKLDLAKFASALVLLVARMWVDDSGKRLFSDGETKELETIDLDFYEVLSVECQRFAKPEASQTLGESGKTTGSDSLVESA